MSNVLHRLSYQMLLIILITPLRWYKAIRISLLTLTSAVSLFGSSLAFVSKRVTRAILKDGGTVPLLIDILTIFVMIGTSELTCLLSTCVGIGCSVHDLVADSMITWCSSSSVAFLNVDKWCFDKICESATTNEPEANPIAREFW